MSINGGYYSPGTYAREEQPTCCSRCRRGMPGMQGPCGYSLNCGCHRRSE